MSTVYSNARQIDSQTGFQRVSSAFAREAIAMLQALIFPGAILADMDRLADLLARAHAVESSDPLRAAELRRSASRVGRG